MDSRVLPPAHAARLPDLELRGPHRWGCRVGSFLLNATSPMVFLSLSRPRSTPRLSPPRGSRRPVPPTLAGRRITLLGLSKDRPSIEIPCRVHSPLRSAAYRSTRFLGAFGAVLPSRSRATRSRSDLAVCTASPVCSSPGCRGVAPGPDHGVRLVSRGLGSRLHLAPRAALLPFEALLPDESHPDRSRGRSGGSSPRGRCRPRVHRTPCLLALGGLTHLDLEALLSHRSRAPVRRFRRRRALAPLGLSIPSSASPR